MPNLCVVLGWLAALKHLRAVYQVWRGRGIMGAFCTCETARLKWNKAKAWEDDVRKRKHENTRWNERKRTGAAFYKPAPAKAALPQRVLQWRLVDQPWQFLMFSFCVQLYFQLHSRPDPGTSGTWIFALFNSAQHSSIRGAWVVAVASGKGPATKSSTKFGKDNVEEGKCSSNVVNLILFHKPVPSEWSWNRDQPIYMYIYIYIY